MFAFTGSPFGGYRVQAELREEAGVRLRGDAEQRVESTAGPQVRITVEPVRGRSGR